MREYNGGPPAAATEWPALVPLDDSPELPPFPVECLPNWLSEWVIAEADATQTPLDLAAMLTVTGCGAGIARKFRSQIRRGWTEPTNIYSVTAIQVGEQKSATFADTMAPIQQFEREE